jgi:hypothetical protein
LGPGPCQPIEVCTWLGNGAGARGAAHPEARVVPPDATALGLEHAWIDEQGGLRLRPDYWPARGGMDGFYAACLERRPDAA